MLPHDFVRQWRIGGCRRVKALEILRLPPAPYPSFVKNAPGLPAWTPYPPFGLLSHPSSDIISTMKAFLQTGPRAGVPAATISYQSLVVGWR